MGCFDRKEKWWIKRITYTKTKYQLIRFGLLIVGKSMVIGTILLKGPFEFPLDAGGTNGIGPEIIATPKEGKTQRQRSEQ